MALQKKEQTENKKARELFFSRPKKRKQSNLSLISPKKYWQKLFWTLFLSKTVI